MENTNIQICIHILVVNKVYGFFLSEIKGEPQLQENI